MSGEEQHALESLERNGAPDVRVCTRFCLPWGVAIRIHQAAALMINYEWQHCSRQRRCHACSCPRNA